MDARDELQLDPAGPPPSQIAYASRLNHGLPTLALENIPILQQASACRNERRLIVRTGVADIITGPILVAVVPLFSLIVGIGPGFGAMVWMTAGATIAALGVWNVVAPSPIGIMLSGANMTVLILIDYAYTWRAGHGSEVGEIAILIFVLIFATFRIMLGRYLHNASTLPPSPQLASWMDATARSIRRGHCAGEPDLIEFKLRGLRWKAQLLSDLGLFVGDREGMFFLSRDAAQIELVGVRTVPKQVVKARFTLGSIHKGGVISASSLDRFDRWKAGETLAAPEVAPRL